MKPLLGNLARVVLGTLLGFLLVEAGARAYLAWPSDPRTANFIEDPEADYRIRPDRPEEIRDPDDHFTALGVRGREHTIEKSPGTYRVLGIGDSFVFGSVPMRDNFLRVAEREANIPNPGIEVIPLGVPGYNPENYLGILRSVGLSLEPDLVLMFFFVGNDVTGIPVRGRVYRGELYYVGSASPWLDLLRRSRFLMLLETVTLRTLKQLHDSGEEVSGGGEPQATEPGKIGGSEPGGEDGVRRGAKTDATTPTVDESSSEPSLPYLFFQRKRLPIYTAHPDPGIEKLWHEAEGYLTAFDQTCREAGVPWILVAVPAELQVDESIRTKVLEALSRPAEDYDFEAPQFRLAEFSRRSGIEFIDLLPTLRRAHLDSGRLYIANNTHWNVEGNRVVGSLLAGTLKSRRERILPGGTR